ncbi:MAG: hypothetical protein ACLPKI_28335 [Streptosporangiaceae bacterium]
MTPAEPELDDGADDDPSEPELDEDDEPEPDDEPDVEPVPTEDPPDTAECPVLVLAGDPAALVVLPWAMPGSSAATTPATATPRIPAPMVAVRSRRRARSRATTADTVRSSLFMESTPLTDADLFSVGAATLTALGGSSPPALSGRGPRSPAKGAESPAGPAAWAAR